MTGAPPPGSAGEPRLPDAGTSLLAWLWGEQGQTGEYAPDEGAPPGVRPEGAHRRSTS